MINYLCQRFIYVVVLALSAFSINAFGQTCQQPSRVWVHGLPDGGQLQNRPPFFPTGVVQPYSKVTFNYYNITTGSLLAPFYTHLTKSARSNCVIHHEPEEHSTTFFTPGVYRVLATYYPWELANEPIASQRLRRDEFVAQFEILPTTSGGGGDDGGDDGGGYIDYEYEQCVSDYFYANPFMSTYEIESCCATPVYLRDLYCPVLGSVN